MIIQIDPQIMTRCYLQERNSTIVSNTEPIQTSNIVLALVLEMSYARQILNQTSVKDDYDTYDFRGGAVALTRT